LVDVAGQRLLGATSSQVLCQSEASANTTCSSVRDSC